MTAILFGDEIQRYSSKMSTEALPVLEALERETFRKEMQPVMLSGHVQGAFLQLMSKIIGPKNVLDIGTFTGYSAICLAQGLAEKGKVHTIEIDEERKDIAQKYFEASGLSAQIIPHYGDASTIIPQLEEEWDLVFIDADKPNYEHYFDLVIDSLRLGGLIIADNVLFEGRVLLPEQEQGKNERAMHSFNHKVKNDSRIETLVLPFRDGISLLRKIAH